MVGHMILKQIAWNRCRHFFQHPNIKFESWPSQRWCKPFQTLLMRLEKNMDDTMSHLWNIVEAHLLRIHRSKTYFEGWLSDPESGIRSVCQKKVPIGTAQCTIWSRHVSSWTSTHHTQFTYFQLLHSYDLISDVISALNANLYLIWSSFLCHNTSLELAALLVHVAYVYREEPVTQMPRQLPIFSSQNLTNCHSTPITD